MVALSFDNLKGLEYKTPLFVKKGLEDKEDGSYNMAAKE